MSLVALVYNYICNLKSWKKLFLSLQKMLMTWKWLIPIRGAKCLPSNLLHILLVHVEKKKCRTMVLFCYIEPIIQKLALTFTGSVTAAILLSDAEIGKVFRGLGVILILCYTGISSPAATTTPSAPTTPADTIAVAKPEVIVIMQLNCIGLQSKIFETIYFMQLHEIMAAAHSASIMDKNQI